MTLRKRFTLTLLTSICAIGSIFAVAYIAHLYSSEAPWWLIPLAFCLSIFGFITLVSMIVNLAELCVRL